MKEIDPNQQQLFSTRTVADVDEEIMRTRGKVGFLRDSDSSIKKLSTLIFGPMGTIGVVASGDLAYQTPSVTGKIAFGLGSVLYGGLATLLGLAIGLNEREELHKEQVRLTGMVAELREQSKDIRNGKTVLFDPGSLKGEVAVLVPK